MQTLYLEVSAWYLEHVKSRVTRDAVESEMTACSHPSREGRKVPESQSCLGS
jgi:hypothetical protein